MVTLIDRAVVAGGGERVAIEIAMRLDPERFESLVCATRHDAGSMLPEERVAVDELGRAGVPLLGLGRRTTLDIPAWRPLLAYLRRERVDVLHAHLFGSNLWGTVLGRLTGVPVVIAHEHGWAAATTGLGRRLADRHVIGRGTNAFVTVSQETRRRMIEVAGVRPEDVVLVPNGIPELPPPSGSDVRAELGIGAATPVIGTVAVLRPEKDLERLVGAAALLRATVPDLRVLIAGVGPEEPRLARCIEESGLEGTVTLLGFRSDVGDLLAALDVAVFSSWSEGSPLAVMEAMDAARPVVATSVGGIPDLIDDGVHGLLVPPRDSAALAAAIGRALGDREAAAEMGRRARERRRREFGASTMVARVEALYDDRFARSARGRREGFTPRTGAAAAVV